MLTYVEDSPVEFVNGDVLQAQAELLGQSIVAWLGDYKDPSATGQSSQAKEILGYLGAPKRSGLPGGLYKFNGMTIGVVQINVADDAFEIENIVTHPAYSGAGAALIEWVVKLSVMNGKGGRVKLYAANGDAASTYSVLGFLHTKSGAAKDQPGNMTLNAGTSALWAPSTAKTDSKGEITTFTLKRYAGKKFAVALN